MCVHVSMLCTRVCIARKEDARHVCLLNREHAAQHEKKKGGAEAKLRHSAT